MIKWTKEGGCSDYPCRGLFYSNASLYIIYNDAIHQLDKLNSFQAIAFELVSSMARALGL